MDLNIRKMTNHPPSPATCYVKYEYFNLNHSVGQKMGYYDINLEFRMIFR